MLIAPKHRFRSVDGGSIADGSARDMLLQSLLAVETLELKVGAQVMLIKNLTGALVNGRIGLVTGFSGVAPQYPLVRFPACDLEDEELETEIEPTEFTVESPNGKVHAVTRKQVGYYLPQASR